MRLVFSAQMGSLDKVFREISNTIEDVVKDDDQNKKTSLLLAEDLANTINKKYVENLNNISPYEHGSSNIKTSIVETKKGYVVRTSGKDVLYEEYGTGTRGLQNPHPKHNADGMKPYGSGRNVIRNGQKNNGLDAPYWYHLYRDFPSDFKDRDKIPNMPKTDFGNNRIKNSDFVWMHNDIVTKGLPAGKFIYDSCREYRKSTGLADKEVLNRTIKQYIKTNFENKMRKEVKKPVFTGDIKKYMIELKIYEKYKGR